MLELITKLLGMQKLIDNYQESLFDLWLYISNEPERECLKRDCGESTNILSALYRFIHFIRQEHPEAFKDWLKRGK